MPNTLASLPPELLDRILEFVCPPLDPVEEFLLRGRPSAGGIKNDRILALECASLILPSFRQVAQPRLVRSIYMTSSRAAGWRCELCAFPADAAAAAAGAVLGPLVRELTVKVDFWGARVSGYGEHHVPGLSTRMPNLVSLRLEDMTFARPDTIVEACGRLHRISKLDLADLKFRTYPGAPEIETLPSIPSLRLLHVINSNIGDVDPLLLFAILPSFTGLERVVLTRTPSRITPSLYQNLPPAHLPNLDDLVLHGDRLEGLLKLTSVLFTPETLQSLRSIYFEFGTDSKLPSPAPFLVFGPSLRRLSWHGPTSNLRGCIANTPALEHLGLGNSVIHKNDRIWTYFPATLKSLAFSTDRDALLVLREYEATVAPAATLSRVEVFHRDSSQSRRYRAPMHSSLAPSSEQADLQALRDRMLISLNYST